MRERSTIMLVSFNFLYYAMMSIYMTFLPVYLRDSNIAPAEIGLLLGLGTAMGIIAPPLWGYISDRWRNVRRVLLLILAGAILAGTMLFQISAVWLLFFLVICSFFFISPIGPLTDSINYRVAEEVGISFGSIRLFGSIGYGIAALLSGMILDKIGMDSLSYLFLGSGLLALALAWCLPNQSTSAKPISLGGVKQFLTYRPVLWMLLILTMISIPHRTNDSFLGVYIQELGGSNALVGRAWFLGTVSEATAFALGMYWLKKDRELHLMAIATIFYIIRYFLSSIAPSPEWIAWLQLFHGCTYAFFYAAAIQYIYNTAPDELKATGQTVFGAIFFGLSGIIGSTAGGWVLELYGGHTLYQAMASMALVSFLLVMGTLRYAKRNKV